MRRIGVLLIGLVLFGLTASQAWAYSGTFTSANTVIVLPTTKIVNGIPVHIGEDAITGSRLGAFLVLQGITPSTYKSTVSVPVDYHSVLIPDENQVYKLNSVDMPDVGIKVGDEPVGDTVVVQVNFSRIEFNSTKKAAQFMDRSIELVFNENTTPLDLDVGGDYKSVSTTVDGKDILYLYSYEEKISGQDSAGDSLIVGDWKLTFKDIDVDGQSILVDWRHLPTNNGNLDVMEKSVYYVMYVDDDGNIHYDTVPSLDSVQTLLEGGVQNLFVFYVSGIFQGAFGTNLLEYSYWYYEKIKEYHDGDVYKGQWVWDIDPANNLYILYLHVNESNEDFPKVFVYYGAALELPMDWGLRIVPSFKKDDNGNIVGIYGYRFVRRKTITKEVTVNAPKVEATDDVYEFIIEDVQLKSIPSDKNIVIVGGWVSNKAWDLLETVYGADLIDSLKAEINQKGYVVKELDNPNNPQYKVIILAGKTYEETRKAVEEFMENM